MTGKTNAAEPIVGFNRHPAASNRDALLPPAYPAPDPADPTEPLTWDPTARFAPPGPASLRRPILETVVPLAAPTDLLRPRQVAPARIRFLPAVEEPAPQPPEPPPPLPVLPPPLPEPAIAVPERVAPPPAPEPVPPPPGPEPDVELPLEEPAALLPPEDVEPIQIPEPQPTPELALPEIAPSLSPRPARGSWRARLRKRPLRAEPPVVAPLAETPPETVQPLEPAPPAGVARAAAPIVEDPPSALSAELSTGPQSSPETAEDLAWPPGRYAESLVADDGQWGPEYDHARLRRPARPKITRALVAVAALLVIAGLVAAVARLVSSWQGEGSITAVFNAPMMVVRAAVTGRVMVVSAVAGEVVDPKSPLFTIHTSDANSPDRSVLAGVHGLVRSVETVPGADLTAGTPLVRIHDCDRAFLTVPPDAKLTAGEAVRVKLPKYPPFTGTVRAATGVMEPPNGLVVGLPPDAIPGACPVGATGSVTPVAKA